MMKQHRSKQVAASVRSQGKKFVTSAEAWYSSTGFSRTVLTSLVLMTCAAAFTLHPELSRQPGKGWNLIKDEKHLVWNSPTRTERLRIKLASSVDDTEGPTDLEEWKALVASLKMYKAAYGNLKVPSRFVVPSMPPWPKKAWGMKLGKRVAMIRSTGKYVNNNEARRKMLDSMGFIWRLRTSAASKVTDGISYDQIFDAIRAFKQEYPQKTDSVDIPKTFVVPDCDPWPMTTRGMPLGKKLASMRTKTFLKSNPDVEKKLKELGVELSVQAAVNDSRFQRVYDALRRYKEVYGDLLVPQPFVVPDESEEWPENTWGLRLGARVNAIRSQGTFVNTNPERRDMLDDIGFIWNPPPTERRRGSRKKDGEEEEETGGTPPEASVPTETSSAQSEMDSLFGPSSDFDNQEPFNFNTEADPMDSKKWALVDKPSGLVQRKKSQAKPDYKPPKSFQESLEEAKAMAESVGIIEYVEVENGHRMRKGKLEKTFPWYNDDFGDDFVFDDVVEGFTIYKNLYGDFSNLTVNYDFVVPAPEKSVFGELDASATFDVEASARAAAAIAAYEEQGRTEESEDLIAAEIKRVQEEVEGERASETLTETETKPQVEWPEHLSGMMLGNIFKRIRDGSLEVRHLPERKAKLNAIGFDWGDPEYYIDVPFEKAMCAFLAYYLIRGDMFVYDDFVIPNEDPWPSVFAGYEVGLVAKRVRQLQNFIEAYHPEKVQLLRMVEFVWFPTMALPLPSRLNTTLEYDRLSAYGHPDYAQLHDPPPGLFENIMEQGPLYDPDHARDFFRVFHDWEYVKDLWYELGCRDRAKMLNRTGYGTLAAEHEAKYGFGMYRQMDVAFDELRNGAASESEASRRGYIEKLLRWRDDMQVSIDTTKREIRSRTRVVDTWLKVLLNSDEMSKWSEEGNPTNELRDMFGVPHWVEKTKGDGEQTDEDEIEFDYQSLCFDDKPFGDFFLREDDDCYFENEDMMIEEIKSMRVLTGT